MSKKVSYVLRFLVVVLAIIFQSCNNQGIQQEWETLEVTGKPTARHEAGLVGYKNKLYLIGGRRINPTDEFDTTTNTWTAKSPTPIELHHFQPVVVGDAIYLMGAMTGQWPFEKPLDRIVIYYPEKDVYVYGDSIPKGRRRGGAGAVYYNGKIYLVGGITQGHMNGYKSWFDAYDPKTGEWTVLPNAPNARDHFQAAVLGDKLYAFAGRRTSKITNQDMELTNTYGNIYNFETKQWEKVNTNMAIPTERAGNGVFTWKDQIVIGGGESMAHQSAHNEVEAFHTKKVHWSKWPSLNTGRHGTGFAVIGDYVYVASGCGERGGTPELFSVERLKLPNKPLKSGGQKESKEVYKKWHTITLSFTGPETSETSPENPFLDYKLWVSFKHKDRQYKVRGFYAADGNAAHTGADKGAIWQVRFTPDIIGEWEYSATLVKGKNIALERNESLGDEIKIEDNKGVFVVTPSDKEGVDFKSRGRLEAHDGYYKFQDSDKYWIKGGTNSPENLLGYVDFDNTYRMQSSQREGEAATDQEIHRYESHTKDWKFGDPTWKSEKGKSIIGAMNYLASKGMNSVYFLTMNIGGDGKDVWPYVDPDDTSRFDVSKLEQWEILFEHMQSKGLMLHMVLQETENETWLDSGNTGPMRQLYLQELIARFGHHLGLTWNLGEENGPASWTPVAQNDRQRKDMTQFLKETDPYKHPILLHTHSHEPTRGNVLDSILGFKYLDGLSLQQDKRELVSDVINNLKTQSKKSGNNWLISMDEIGMWHTGATPDSDDTYHDSLRRYALWGTLMSGGAGVEWYFGAKYPHNDLNSEDWRERDHLWDMTFNAISFFDQYLPFWEMVPKHDMINSSEAFCFAKKEEVYTIYLPTRKRFSIDLKGVEGQFTVDWYSPLLGGGLKKGSKQVIAGNGVRDIGLPPSLSTQSKLKDWVCLLRRVQKKGI